MKTFVTVFFTLLAMTAMAQRDFDDQTKSSLKDRLYVGGGLGLNGGTDYNGYRYFYVQVSPIIGYMLTPKFSAGAGINYQYIRYSDLGISRSQYGLNPFVRYNFLPLFFQAEYNILSVNNSTTKDYTNRGLYNRFLVGLGISQPLGNRGSVNALAMYDLLYQNNGVFVSPWVLRLFFTY